MIRVKLLDGPYGGKIREIPLTIEPVELLGEISSYGWHWEIDYSKASEEERFSWGRRDLVVRVVRALMGGRPVYFLGREYRGANMVGELEDTIVFSGRMIRLGFDDKRGVQILAPEIERL